MGHWRGGEVHEFFEAASYPYDTTGEQVLQIESNGQVDDVPYILTGDTLTLNGFHYDKPTSFFTYGVYVRVGSPEADAVMEEWEELQVTAKAQWDSYYTEEIQQDQARECLYMRGLLSSVPFRYLRALETGVLGDGAYELTSDMTEAERQALRAKLAAKMRSDFRAVETLDDMVRVLIENSKTKDGWGEWSIMQPDELESFECQAGGTITVTFEDDTFETDASCLPTFECSVHGSSE